MEKVSKLHFVVKKEERVFEFIAPAGAPFGEAHDALYSILAEILRMAQEVAEKAKPEDEKTA